MLTIFTVIFVLIGFLFWFLATQAVTNAEAIARGCFLVAAILWAVGLIAPHIAR